MLNGTGMLTCDRCGSKFIGTAARGNRYQYRYYTCHRRNRYGLKGCASERLPAAELDEAIRQSMIGAYSDVELVAKALEETRRRMPAVAAQLQDDLAGVEARIAETERALERYFLAFEAGTMNEQACASRVGTLTQGLADQRCERVRLQNAIDLDDPLPSIEEVKPFLAEVVEMLKSDSRADHKTVTSALMGHTIVKGRHSVRPAFIVPTQKVRVLSRVVHPALHNKNLLTFLNGREIVLAARHSKVRRLGYSRG